MSNAPYFGQKISRSEFGEMKSTMVHDGLWDVYNDEHMGNTGEAIADMLFSLRRERESALVLVTHDTALASRCDRVLVMEAGRLTLAE